VWRITPFADGKLHVEVSSPASSGSNVDVELTDLHGSAEVDVRSDQDLVELVGADRDEEVARKDFRAVALHQFVEAA
jgi:hypothetical protein